MTSYEIAPSLASVVRVEISFIRVELSFFTIIQERNAYSTKLSLFRRSQIFGQFRLHRFNNVSVTAACTSFATRGQLCSSNLAINHMGGQIVKSH